MSLQYRNLFVFIGQSASENQQLGHPRDNINENLRDISQAFKFSIFRSSID